jgi:hypothetical protein
MNVVEGNAWTAFKNVVEKLLGNHKDEDYKNIVRIMCLKIFTFWDVI